MSYSLVTAQQGHKSDALRGLKDVAAMEERREENNRSMKQQRQAQKSSGAGSGATIGSMMAMGAGAGPVGILAAGAAGLLGGWLLS